MIKTKKLIDKSIYETLAKDLWLECIADRVLRPAKDHVYFYKNNKKYILEIKEEIQ